MARLRYATRATRACRQDANNARFELLRDRAWRARASGVVRSVDRYPALGVHAADGPAVAGLHRGRIHPRRPAVRRDPAAALGATWRSGRSWRAVVRARARERGRGAAAIRGTAARRAGAPG